MDGQASPIVETSTPIRRVGLPLRNEGEIIAQVGTIGGGDVISQGNFVAGTSGENCYSTLFEVPIRRDASTDPTGSIRRMGIGSGVLFSGNRLGT